MHLVTTDEMRRIEAAADAQGHSYAEMMRRAGLAVAEAVVAQDPGAAVLVLAGPGNNGGDGLVAAAELAARGHEVAVYLWKRPPADPLVDAAQDRGVAVVQAADDPELDALRAGIAGANVVVDALLGTGLSRPLAPDVASILAAIRASAGRVGGPFVVAVDVPTGLHSDDGSLDPHTVPADLTVTFGFPKVGQVQFPGAEAVGRLVIDPIGIPAMPIEGELYLATPAELASRLPDYQRSAHKGTFGKVLVVAGSLDYTGAAYLAAAAAYRAGCGLVTAAVPQSIHAVVAVLVPEATFLPLPDRDGHIAPAAAERVRAAWSDYDALLVGPGLSGTADSAAFVEALLTDTRGAPPLVVDADGLNHLATLTSWPSRLPASAVLTPHPGEMARLLGERGGAAAVNADRLAVARSAAQAWGHVVVLKGAFTATAAPEGQVTVNPFATPALATAGTGDVLAGLVAGLLAQGLAAYDAAVVGAWLHGFAGQLLEDAYGPRGGLTRELLAQLPAALVALRAAGLPASSIP